jgi:hypothetical protein
LPISGVFPFRQTHMYRFIFLLTMLVSGPLQALTLFGQDFQQTDRTAMRSAVKNSGAKLVKESVDDGIYDVYESDKLLAGSSRLYLGFTNAENRLAFVEYDFVGFQQDSVVQKLTSKYGKPEIGRARFLSDRGYQWVVDGIRITLYQDWPAYRTRLIYTNPQDFQAIRTEYRQYLSSKLKSATKDLDQAY